MSKGIRLGRFLGINIHVDWSWLIIFGLITWNLASGFGQIHQDWSTALAWATAALAALLFFFSVAAHEMAHSLVARAQGVPVRNITFFLFGGVSNIEREPNSPQNEFVLSIVGPITSFGLGLLFLALSGVNFGSLPSSVQNPEALIADFGPLTTLLLWLGPINIILGAFNLVPGFPLDGGRILRSILWAFTDNLHKATLWASRVGQLIAWLMIGSGIAMAFGVQIPFFGTGLLSGLWLFFIGWFLHNAASQSYRRLIVRDLLEDVSVSRLMRNDPPVVSPACSINDLVHEHVMGTDEHAFPVIQDHQLLGLVTLEDIRSVPRERWDQMTVKDIMTPRKKLQTINIEADGAEAMQKLRRGDIRQLPVLQQDSLIGLLRRRDIIKWLQFQSDVVGS